MNYKAGQIVEGKVTGIQPYGVFVALDGSNYATLAEAQEAGRLKKGDNIIMVAFGAGLTWAGALVKWAK